MIYLTTYCFPWHKYFQVGSESDQTDLRIRISNSRLRIRGPGSERNIFRIHNTGINVFSGWMDGRLQQYGTYRSTEKILQLFSRKGVVWVLAAHSLSPPPRLAVHEDLEAALDDKEEVDAQPHRQRDVQVPVVRIELNLGTENQYL